jgi:hypothetical protein
MFTIRLMRKVNTISLVAMPSVSSFLISSGISFFIILISFWGAVKNVPIVKETIDLISSRSDIIKESSSSFDAVIDTIFASSVANQMFYMMLWGLVGVLVYFAVIFIGKGNKDLMDILTPKGSKGVKNSRLWVELVSRLFFRIFVLILWVMFAITSAVFLVPLGVSSVQAASDFNALEDIQFLLYAFIILFSTFHLHAVFLRLFVIKVRVFGQADEAILHD